jgi:hypothetical protein
MPQNHSPDVDRVGDAARARDEMLCELDLAHGDAPRLRGLLARLRVDERLHQSDRDELVQRLEGDVCLAEHFDPLPEEEELAASESLLIVGGQFVRNPGVSD